MDIFSGDIIQFMNRYGYDCYAIVRFGEYEQDGSGNEYPPTRCLGFFVEVDSFTCPDGEDGAESFPVHLYRQNLLEVCEDCTVIGNLWDNDDLVEGRIIVTPSALQELRKQRGMERLPSFSDYLERHKPKSLMKVLWLRTGMSVLITDEEEKVIFGENIDGPTISAIFRNAIMEGRASLDGDSYIPFSSIEQFNRAYDTHYKEDEFGFSL